MAWRYPGSKVKLLSMLASKRRTVGACPAQRGGGEAARNSGAMNVTCAAMTSPAAPSNHQRRPIAAPTATSHAGKYTTNESALITIRISRLSQATTRRSANRPNTATMAQPNRSRTHRTSRQLSAHLPAKRGLHSRYPLEDDVGLRRESCRYHRSRWGPGCVTADSPPRANRSS